MRRIGDDGSADPRSMLPLPVHTHTINFVCTTCGGLWSPDTTPGASPWGVPDRCGCRPIADEGSLSPRDTRGRPDAGIPCTLCATCGLAIVPGHSRWKLHHCRGCVPIVDAVNRAAGRLVVPIGIHSILNRLPSPVITTDEAADRVHLTAWWDQFDAMARSSVRVRDHGRALVLELVRQCRLTGRSELTVNQLRTECERRNIDHRFGIALMLRAALTGHDPLLDDT